MPCPRSAPDPGPAPVRRHRLTALGTLPARRAPGPPPGAGYASGTDTDAGRREPPTSAEPTAAPDPVPDPAYGPVPGPVLDAAAREQLCADPSMLTAHRLLRHLLQQRLQLGRAYTAADTALTRYADQVQTVIDNLIAAAAGLPDCQLVTGPRSCELSPVGRCKHPIPTAPCLFCGRATPPPGH